MSLDKPEAKPVDNEPTNQTPEHPDPDVPILDPKPLSEGYEVPEDKVSWTKFLEYLG